MGADLREEQLKRAPQILLRASRQQCSTADDDVWSDEIPGSAFLASESQPAPDGEVEAGPQA